jgi:hypothetical protein
MATKEQLDLEIRLIAIEAVLTQIGKIACIAAGITPELARQMSESSRATFLNEAFPGADPAIADHLSAELADRVQALLARIASDVEAAHIAREHQAGSRA